MRIANQDRHTGWIAGAIGPALVLLLVTAYLPIVCALTLSLYHRSAFDPQATWAGLENFRWLLRQRELWASLWRSLMFTVGAVGF